MCLRSSGRRDQAARLVGLLNARAASNRLRDRFDIDWFRNPRAWTDLREQGARPADGTVDGAALDAAAGDLGRAFEEALG